MLDRITFMGTEFTIPSVKYFLASYTNSFHVRIIANRYINVNNYLTGGLSHGI